ncbi:CRISPR system Cascade subunit CasD [Kitasatospora sp. GP30]|uniref:type I-E CRISPR-associated protein Cas5/CasD n=1 Tax=Kitasatospora sp. GP30 TaxID=3035084 RepID=UPI000C702FD6|nr:type I-E CRISPR-associated protein Cas5/CasD [Kitasatospora sp. GP30]MDH6139872.1 CRISPR system Cascade subunit CasD [Kitasatospora sp. GP30]
MTGLLLRLAGPLQSWGERSAFNPIRDSAPFPTRSGLIGMFAAAAGLHRGADLHRYRDLEFTVRIDRPGTPLTDFHTAGGGLPKDQTAATSGGDHKGDAVVTHRHYLADAVFTVAVTGPGDTIADIATALQRPHWAPYLGRRSCVPDEPLLLRPHVDNPVEELLERVPLSTHPTRQPRHDQDTIPVEFIWENHPDPLPQNAVALTIYDNPTTFAQHNRAHAKRQLHRTACHLPARLAADTTTPVFQRLFAYMHHEEEVPA